ncbi:MAG: hypothetical protein AAFW98_20620, partial [Pseudomonadota bacterium]
LWKQGYITYEEALKRCTNPDEFKLKAQGIQSTSDIARTTMDNADHFVRHGTPVHPVTSSMIR